MTCRRVSCLLLLALTGAGCGGAGGASPSNGKADSAFGAGGDSGSKQDAGPVINIDIDAGVAQPDAMAPNVFADAPPFNWDAPGGPGGSNSGGAGGSTAASGGVTGSGGSASGGRTGSGGAPGSGGRSNSGGSSAAGGMSSAGGTTSMGGMSSAGGTTSTGGTSNTGGTSATGGSGGLGGSPVDGGVLSPDASAGCVARIVPVLPAVLDDTQNFVAAPYVKIALRAEVVSGTVPAGTSWTWQARWNGAQLPAPEIDPLDPATAAFPVVNEGDYVFTAYAGSCITTFNRSARGPGGCYGCDHGTDVQIVSPPSYALSTQGGYFAYAGAISLAESHVVKFFTSVGNNLVPSYVRINNPDGTLVTDGYVDPSVGFSRPLLVLASNGDVARYQVLVVPMDGSGDGTSGASAPQLFKDLTNADLSSSANLKLSGGVTVSGTTLAASGLGVTDTRVMLSNQNPAGPATLNNLIFSSVGSSNAQGSYTLHAQPGDKYWVGFSPPAGSGLSEAIDPLPISLTANATLGFQWYTPVVAPLTLNVVDAGGVNPVGYTRVLVSSTQSSPVGTLIFQEGGGSTVRHEANGSLQTEATTDAYGLVTFPALPADATYDLLLVPATLNAAAATTLLQVTLPAGGLTQTVRLVAERNILGKLAPGKAGSAVPDWTQVQVVAYDKSLVVPEPPRTIPVSADGTFALGVSPGRPYTVLVVPNPATGLARTFFGPGLMQSTGLRTTQYVQSTMDWTSTVSITTNNQATGIVGAALQATCHPGYWRCIDPSLPLAETTSGAGGTFTLSVPDPDTRW
jgi:hypothetical protein